MEGIDGIANGIAEILSDYNAQVCYAPDFELKKMQVMKVCVCPTGKKRTVASRGSCETVYSIEVAIVHKCREDGLESRLVGLSEKIGDLLLKASICGFTCTETAWEPLYSVESLRDSNVFISVIGLLFKRIS